MNMDAQLANARHQRAVAEFEKQKMEKLLHSKEVELAKATSSFRQELNRLRGKLRGYGWNGEIGNELVPYVNPISNDDTNSTADPQLQAETIQGLKEELTTQKELSGLTGMMLSGIAEHLITASEGLNNSTWRLAKTDDGGWDFKKADLAETETQSSSTAMGPTPPSPKSPPGGEPSSKSEPSPKSPPGGEPSSKSEVVQGSSQLPSTSSTALFFQREPQSDADDEDDAEGEKPMNSKHKHGAIDEDNDEEGKPMNSKHSDDEDDGALSSNSSSSESLFSVVRVTLPKSRAPMSATSSLTSTKKQLGGTETRVPSLPNSEANREAEVMIESGANREAKVKIESGANREAKVKIESGANREAKVKIESGANREANVKIESRANCEAKVKIEGEMRQKVFQRSSVTRSSASTSFSQTKTKVSGPPRPPPPPKREHGVANQVELLCICGRQFTSKQGLTLHINHCNRSKPDLKCDLCGGPFSNKGLLTIHITRMHGQASDDHRAGLPVKRLHRPDSRGSKPPQVKRERV